MEGSGEEERRRTRVMNSHVPPTNRRAATLPCPLVPFCTSRIFLKLMQETKGLKLKSSRGQAHTQVRGARLSNTPGSTEDHGRKPGPRASALADRLHVE